VCPHHIHREVNPTRLTGQNIARIFAERGHEFLHYRAAGIADPAQDDEQSDGKEEEEASNHIMTAEELYKMRMELAPHL